MASLIRILRDPVWQAIGVLVAVITIFISTSKVTKDVELSVVHWRKIDFNNYWLPLESIKLQFQNQNKDINNIGVDYFLLINSSSKPIVPSDYIAQLSVKKVGGNNRLYVVESCSQQMAQQCSSDGLTGTGAAYVSFAWKAEADIWSATPALLNPGDQSCVVLISDKDVPDDKPIKDRFRWDGRLINVRIKTYQSGDEYYKSRGKSPLDYFFASVILQGCGIYWFIFLQFFLFIVFLYFGSRAQWLPLVQKKHMIKIWLFALLSITSSEILVDIFINRRQELHLIVWPLLLAHFALCIFLLSRIFKQRNIVVDTEKSE